MKIPNLVLLVYGIFAILSENDWVLNASATVSDDCCEKYDQGGDLFEMVYGIQGSVANLTCPFSTSTNKVSWRGPPNLTSFIAARGSVNKDLSRTYKWITETQTEENILQLQNTSQEDEGIFRCQVYNEFAIYFCFCLSKSPTLIDIENRTTTYDLIGIQNKQLTLKCSVKSGRPKEKMTWTTASGKELTNGGPQSISYILTPQITDDGKQLICKAYHSPFYAVNISVRLRVFSIPVVQILPVTNNIVQEGDSILRKCDSYSNDPLTNYKWCWLNHTISRNNTLYIKNIRRHEAGKYVCEAKNRAGVNSSEITVIVQYAPNVSVIRTTSTRSNDIMLKCHAYGIPNNFTFFRWEHRTLFGQHLRFLETGGTLLLPTVSQKTRYYINGIYSCNVSNGIPKTNGILFQTARHTLYCEGKPVFMTTNKEVQYGRFQQMGMIVLTIWSYPKPTNIEMGYAESFNQLPNKKFNLSMKNTTVQDVIYDRTVDINGFEIRIGFDIEKENQFTNYTVRVLNEKGFSDLTIDFKSAKRPETPTNLAVVPSEQSITVLWYRNFDGGYPQSFIIQYRSIHSEEWTELLPISDNQLPRQEAVLQKLLLETEYDIRIFARNRVNDSNLSETIRVRTHAPNVSVLRTTTSESNDIMLKCHVDGIPDNFTFFRWEHRTLLGQHLRFLESGKTLFLPFVNQETHYYRNGIYSCNVSHSIPKANGVIFQTAQYKLYEMGKPVFMTTNNDVQDGRFQQMGTIAVSIWSYPKPTIIEIGSAETYHQLPNENFSLSLKYTILQDAIFERTVGIYGYEIKITFDIEKQNQFTNYTVRVFNEKGFSVFTIDFKSARISGGDWIIYSLLSAIIVIIIGVGICLLKYRQNARRRKKINNRIAINITADHAQRDQNGVYDEIDETLLVDNVQGIPNSRHEGVTNSSRMQLDNAEDLQPYQEEVSSASGAINVDRFGYLMPCQRPEHNQQEKSQGYEENDPSLGNNQKSDETFAKEVYPHQSYQELQMCWQESFQKYDTPNLNIKGLVAKQMNCTNVSNEAKMMKESHFDGYTDAMSLASK